MSKDSLIKLKNVSKFYYNKGTVASGFSRVSVEFNSGEFVVITGESGSGKSTLLNVISGLDTYEEGEMYINGKETSHYSTEDFEHYRKTYIGNIFQNFNLINSYTVYQNIELVLLLNGFKKKDIKNKIIDLIKKVDLYKYRNTRVSHLSGGQKQRVAIARALAKETPIIIADEPTGNLDTKSAKSVLELLSKIAKDKLVIIVTHNYEQVEKYATRKIEMSDGKIREDVLLKECNNSDINVYEYSDIRYFSKLRIGIRNTFNIVPKFLLMFLVFFFVTLAFLFEYAGFQYLENSDETIAYGNYVNTDKTRIVLNKKDKSIFSESELNNIKNLSNVSYVEKNDTFLDSTYYINTDDYMIYLNGVLKDISYITEVSEGRMPLNKNEIVVYGSKDNYYLNSGIEELSSKKINLTNDYSYNIGEDLTIVGLIYDDTDDMTFYVNEDILKEAIILNNVGNSTTKSIFNNVIYEYTNVLPTNKLSEGQAMVSNELNYRCTYNWCQNKTITLDVKNIYYSEKVDLTISNVFYKSTYKTLTGRTDYLYNTETIFVSYEDYNKLYKDDIYQISVFANDYRNVDAISDNLKSMGYTPVKIKDVYSNSNQELAAIIKIVKTVVLIGLYVGLFFVSYFVIKLIQKSKNIYYSTIRILGSSKKVINSLIRLELFTIFNITYILILIIFISVRFNIIKLGVFNDISTYLSIKDYIFIYLLLCSMSYLISSRYSRKLFKSSAMKSYREEV